MSLSTFAQELTIGQCMDAASGGNITLRKSSLDVMAAKAQQGEARWEFAPRVGVTSIAYDALNPLLKVTLGDILGSSDAAQVLRESITTLAYENGIKPYYSTLSRGYGVTATLIQPLYAGGRIISGNRLADLGVEAAGLKDRLVRKTVRDSVENKFWRIVALQEKRRTLDEAFTMLEQLEKDLGSAVSSGLALESDMVKLRLKKGELKSGMHRLDGSMSLLKMDLLDFVGIEYNYMELSGISLSGSLEGLPSPAEVLSDSSRVESMDEARLLELAVEAKKTEKRMATGEFLPQVAIGATYGYNAMMLPKKGSMNGMVFAMVKIPLTDIGKSVARSRRYEYAVRQAEMDRDYLMSRLRLQEAKQRLDVETLWDEVGDAAEAAAYAEDMAEKTRVRMSAGQATASQVLQATMDVTTAREALLRKKISYMLAVNAWRHR